MCLSHAFAVVDDLQSLMAAIRRRIDDLGITLETAEHIGGLQSGYLSKMLGNPPLKRASPWSWFIALQSLGLRVALVEDSEAAARLGKKWERRKARKPVLSAPGTPRAIELAPDFMRRIPAPR